MKFDIDFLWLFKEIFSTYNLKYYSEDECYLNLYNDFSGLNLFIEPDLKTDVIFIRIDNCLCECGVCDYCLESLGSFEYEFSKSDFYKFIEIMLLPNFTLDNYKICSEYYNIFLSYELRDFMDCFNSYIGKIEFKNC